MLPTHQELNVLSDSDSLFRIRSRFWSSVVLVFVFFLASPFVFFMKIDEFHIYSRFIDVFFAAGLITVCAITALVIRKVRPKLADQVEIHADKLKIRSGKLETFIPAGPNLSNADLGIAQRALSVMADLSPQETQALVDRYGIDFSNNLSHIFDNSLHDHALEALVQSAGSPAQAFIQIQNAVDSLVLNAGQFKTAVSVQGVTVTVTGIVQNGITKISTVYR